MHAGGKAVAVGCTFLGLAALAMPAAGDVSGIISRPAQYYSGTNSGFSAEVMTTTPGSYLVWATMYVNGEPTASYTWNPGDPNFTDWGGPLNFDSTHFQDGQSITVSIAGINNLGESGGVGNPARPVYNKAYVYGNDWQYEGTLHDGSPACIHANDAFVTAHHTVTPNQSGDAPLRQHKPDIIAALPPSTALYAWTHGTATKFGDSSSSMQVVSAKWVDWSDVCVGVGSKSSSQPPFNFVFLDACLVGSESTLADSFGVSAFADRAFLGWPISVPDDQPFEDWSWRLFIRLASGDTLLEARTYANTHGDGQPHDNNGNGILATIYGDTSFKLHGVYLGAALSFWR
jgi:hypothetical protein